MVWPHLEVFQFSKDDHEGLKRGKRTRRRQKVEIKVVWPRLGVFQFSKDDPKGIIKGKKKRNIDGWRTCDFTSFSTVFQSYQDDGQMTMKGCV